MNCEKCKNLSDIEDLSRPYVVRTCSKCDRKIKLREPGENGHAIKIDKGDQFILPSGFLQVSANPLKSTSHLTKHGIGWFAELIFIEALEKNSDKIDQFLDANQNYCGEKLSKSEILKGLDINNEANSDEIFKRIEEHKEKFEWWAYLFGMFNHITKEAIAENDAKKAAWAMRAAERCRSMCIFKDCLEEVVWMGHSAGRIIEIIRKWHANKENNNEEFWQVVFNENPYVLSQVFSVPVIFIKDKAYIGGMNIEGQKAKFVDFLFTRESSNDALLIEIKTPKTQILTKREYRGGVYNVSKELSGSILQVLNYRRELTKNLQIMASETGHKIDTFNPKCIVIMGNAEKELDNKAKRSSFELFRTNLKDVEIVTYDELFSKAETLASLFNLTWKTQDA